MIGSHSVVCPSRDEPIVPAGVVPGLHLAPTAPRAASAISTDSSVEPYTDVRASQVSDLSPDPYNFTGVHMVTSPQSTHSQTSSQPPMRGGDGGGYGRQQPLLPARRLVDLPLTPRQYDVLRAAVHRFIVRRQWHSRGVQEALKRIRDLRVVLGDLRAERERTRQPVDTLEISTAKQVCSCVAAVSCCPNATFAVQLETERYKLMDHFFNPPEGRLRFVPLVRLACSSLFLSLCCVLTLLSTA